MCTTGLTFAAFVQLFSLTYWPLELFSHFVPQYLVASVVVGCAALALRLPRTTAFAVVLVLFYAFLIWDAFPTHEETNADLIRDTDVSLSVITFNMFDGNPRTDALVDWIATRPADVVLLQETPAPFAARLREGAWYPFQLDVFDSTLDSDSFPFARAITVLSRYPIMDGIKLQPSPRLRVAALARLDIAEGFEPWIVAIDCVEPMSPAMLDDRNRYLLGIADHIAGRAGPLVLAGDFNTSPYSPVFREFLSATNARATALFPVTWPTWLGPLGLRIDHILVRDLTVKNIEVLDSVGSDHRPVRAVLLPAQPHS